MIRSYDEIYDLASQRKRVNLVVINPGRADISTALTIAEEKGWIRIIAVEDKNQEIAAEKAVTLIRNGDAELLMKGDIRTDVLLSALLDKNSGIRTNNRLTHTAVLESPNYNRLMLMTDGGVNPELNENILSSIILNAVEIAGRLNNHHPNVALLSLIEKVSSHVPETGIMANMSKKYHDSGSFTVEGPISIDVAISAASAEIKGIRSKISGKTDIFVGPNITTINFVVKSLLGMGGARGGGIITGAEVAVILLSRSDTMKTKLESIALGVANL